MRWPSWLRPERPDIAICGQGRSGTTALFFKIKQALPPGYSHLFEPSAAELTRSIAEARPLLVKTLGPGLLPVVRSFRRRILLTRDPRDQLVSLLLYHGAYHISRERLAAGHAERCLELLRQKERDPRSISLCRLLQAVTFPDEDPGWVLANLPGHAESLIDASLNQGFFRLRYEDLVAHRLDALRTYLNLDLEDDVAVADEFRRVVRTRKAGQWRHWLTPEDVASLRPLLRRTMVVFRYEDDWQLAAQPVIEPSHCSEYFARVLAERREQLER